MAYYGQRGNYYQAGDNYGRAGNYAYQAGGIFGSIFKGIKAVAGVASKILPGPIGTVAGVVSRIGGGGAPPAVGTMGLIPTFGGRPQLGPMIPEPGIAGAVHRVVPGGKPGYGYYNKDGVFIQGKRPTMNPMNVRALRRASRRLDSFARTARKALRHSPFMLVSRASRGRRGSPGVITRSEASRALRK